jgi:TorA maturation chaperone TorD
MLRAPIAQLSPAKHMSDGILQDRSPVEQARADFYALLSALMLQAPTGAFLRELGRADVLPMRSDNALADSWEKLVLGASLLDEKSIGDEYQRLFTSVSDPLLNPHTSYYLAGFLMDQPLADLRTDLAQLGLARRSGATELEDHLGVLFETMRILIEQERPLALQQHFFQRHIASWASRATQDMRDANANFYRLLADFIDAFLALETEAFAMSEAGEPL